MIEAFGIVLTDGGAPGLAVLLLAVSTAVSALASIVLCLRSGRTLTNKAALNLSALPLLLLGACLTSVGLLQNSMAAVHGPSSSVSAAFTAFVLGSAAGYSLVLCAAPLLAVSTALPWAHTVDGIVIRARWIAATFLVGWMGLVIATGVALRFTSALIRVFAALAYADPENKAALMQRGLDESRQLLQTGSAIPAYLTISILAIAAFAVVAGRRGAEASNALMTRVAVGLGISVIALALST